MGLKQLVKSALINKNNIRYEKELANRLCSYHAWVTGEEAGITLPSNVCDEDSFRLVYNPKGMLSVKASEWIGEWFAKYTEAVLLYGDEDVCATGKERTAPCFKPDWSPDLLDDKFYPGGVVAVRKSWLMEQDAEFIKKWELADCGMCSKEECQQLVRETVELAGGYEKGEGRKHILHIPRILFHNETEAALNEWMEYGADMHKEENLPVGTLLSIVIPSKDNPQLLEKCIGSILQCTAFAPKTKQPGQKIADNQLKYEIIVVDNGSAPDNRRQIESVLHRFRQAGSAGLKRILYHYDAQDFNFSKMCNLGVKKSSGELLLFLNDDVTLACQGTLEKMAALAIRPFTGGVGLKLLYPGEEGESKRIQHAGITNLPMGPVHKLQFCKDEGEYYLGRNHGRHNMLAVTAACLMVEKCKFTEAGGFAEELAVAFNDVDLCFGLYELGYENVCECDMYAYHDESYSRGDDEASEKLARLLAERAKLYARHSGLEGVDPYYSVYLNRDGLDTRIRPMYENGKNVVQQLTAEMLQSIELTDEKLPDKCREDACLMVRVESVLNEENSTILTGWSVVLGDDNACYSKRLLLRSAEGECYSVELDGQYRPDLIENMPDQTNVGLCGFCLEWEEGTLPAGNYWLGVMAQNRVNGTGIINWSNRMVEV